MRLLRRLGFTLVELLVVIAIIGILIALLLPAVQAAREAARRSQCTNNLKQLGLALHNYHDAFKIFPPEGFARGWAGSATYDLNYKTDFKNHNGLVSLLPYIEQQAVYDQYDFESCAATYTRSTAAPMAGLDPATSGNAALISNQIAAFICPSDPGTLLHGYSGTNAIIHTGNTNTSLRGPKTNYDFSNLRNTNFGYWERQAINARFMFGENSTTKMASITDGTSNTVAMAETLHDVCNGVCPAWGYRSWVMSGVDITYSRGLNYNDCSIFAAWYTGDMTPRPTRLADWSTAGSMHPGGLNITLGDASVRFLSETTDRNTLIGIARMSDGSTVQVP